MKLLTLAAMFVLIASESSAASDLCSQNESALAALVAGDPISSAIAEAQKAKPHILAVAGYSIETPGVPGASTCWLGAGVALVIPGTTDVICSAEHGRLQVVAREYARRYNEKLFEASAALKGHECALPPNNSFKADGPDGPPL